MGGRKRQGTVITHSSIICKRYTCIIAVITPILNGVGTPKLAMEVASAFIAITVAIFYGAIFYFAVYIKAVAIYSTGLGAVITAYTVTENYIITAAASPKAYWAVYIGLALAPAIAGAFAVLY